MKRINFWNGWVATYKALEFADEGVEEALRRAVWYLSKNTTGWTTLPYNHITGTATTAGSTTTVNFNVSRQTTLVLPSGYMVSIPTGVYTYTLQGVDADVSAYICPDKDYIKLEYGNDLYSLLLDSATATSMPLTGLAVCAWNEDSSAHDISVYPYLTDEITTGNISAFIKTETSALTAAQYEYDGLIPSSRKTLPSWPELQLFFTLSATTGGYVLEFTKNNKMYIGEASAVASARDINYGPSGALVAQSGSSLEKFFADSVLNNANINRISATSGNSKRGLATLLPPGSLLFFDDFNKTYDADLTYVGTWLPSGHTESSASLTGISSGLTHYSYLSGNNIIIFDEIIKATSGVSGTTWSKTFAYDYFTLYVSEYSNGQSGSWSFSPSAKWTLNANGTTPNNIFSGTYYGVPGYDAVQIASSFYNTQIITAISAEISVDSSFALTEYVTGVTPYIKINNNYIYGTPTQISTTRKSLIASATSSWPVSLLSSCVIGISGHNNSSAGLNADSGDYIYIVSGAISISADPNWYISGQTNVGITTTALSCNPSAYCLTGLINYNTPASYFYKDGHAVMLYNQYLVLYPITGVQYPVSAVTYDNCTGHSGGYAAFVNHPACGVYIIGGESITGYTNISRLSPPEYWGIGGDWITSAITGVPQNIVAAYVSGGSNSGMYALPFLPASAASGAASTTSARLTSGLNQFVSASTTGSFTTLMPPPWPVSGNLNNKNNLFSYGNIVAWKHLIFCLGGYSSLTDNTTIWAYDTTNNMWFNTELTYNFGSKTPTCNVSNDTLYIIDSTSGIVKSFDLNNPLITYMKKYI